MKSGGKLYKHSNDFHTYLLRPVINYSAFTSLTFSRNSTQLRKHYYSWSCWKRWGFPTKSHNSPSHTFPPFRLIGRVLFAWRLLPPVQGLSFFWFRERGIQPNRPETWLINYSWAYMHADWSILSTFDLILPYMEKLCMCSISTNERFIWSPLFWYQKRWGVDN